MKINFVQKPIHHITLNDVRSYLKKSGKLIGFTYRSTVNNRPIEIKKTSKSVSYKDAIMTVDGSCGEKYIDAVFEEDIVEYLIFRNADMTILNMFYINLDEIVDCKLISCYFEADNTLTAFKKHQIEFIMIRIIEGVINTKLHKVSTILCDNNKLLSFGMWDYGTNKEFPSSATINSIVYIYSHQSSKYLPPMFNDCPYIFQLNNWDNKETDIINYDYHITIINYCQQIDVDVFEIVIRRLIELYRLPKQTSNHVILSKILTKNLENNTYCCAYFQHICDIFGYESLVEVAIWSEYTSLINWLASQYNVVKMFTQQNIDVNIQI